MNQDTTVWPADKLDRKKEADYIRSYLNALYAEGSKDEYEGSFVLNLNAPWGYGKTFFLANLKADLSKSHHPVLYFDAWKNDYSKNPLLGFISEIEQSLKGYQADIPRGEELVGNFLSNSKKLLAVIAGIGMNVLVKKISGFGVEEFKDKLASGLDIDSDDIAKPLGDKSEILLDKIVQKSLDEHQQVKLLIDTFRENLEAITKSLQATGKYSLPMYILVDELDRCRPTYAIELLENIKHIFNSSGVFFIVATNKNELANSINAVYGSSFDSLNYLRRFFTQEYTLNIPDRSKYIEQLFVDHRINSDKFIIPFDAKLNNTDRMDVFLFEKVSTAFGLGLRDMDQICTQLKSILLTTSYEKIHYPYLIFVLMYMFKNKNLYLFNFDNFKNFSLICLIKESTDYYSNRNPNPVDFNSIISFYREIAASPMKEVSQFYNRSLNAHEEFIMHPINSEINLGLTSPSISKYPILVQQAGHIT
ncbi:KAP family P-loop NTPase fold protein [Methylotenera sp.]|uniref:KAP family P-loop NTPase fold protein n=1 Tax=Methylotenera sp. TaxID=2051956 RepID=UPI002ED9532B